MDVVERAPKGLPRGAVRGSVKAVKLVLLGLEAYTLVCRVGKGGRFLGAFLADARFLLEGCLVGRVGRILISEGLLRVVVSSSRPISSKWLMSARTLPSSLLREWKEDDLELLEVVIPGGDPGLGMMVSRV